MSKLLLFSFFLTVFTASSQNSSQLFLSEALDRNLPKYLLQVENAIQNRQHDSIPSFFSTLVSEKLVGTYMDNILASNLSRKETDLADFEKPVLLITNPTWRINSKGEQPALNELARVYGDQVDIVILLWGDLKTVKKLSKGYKKKIEVLYVDDTDNKYSRIIKNLKHSLGLPLAFTLTGQKQIIDIQHRFTNRMDQPIKESSEHNFEFYEKMIKKVLFEEDKFGTVPTVSLDD